MRKNEYLITACKAEAWRRLAWRLSIFAVSIYPEKSTPEQYDITFLDGMPHFWNEGKWEAIEDGVKNEALFDTNDNLTLNPGDYPGITKATESTPGYLVMNWVVLYFAFEGRIPYYNRNYVAPRLSELKDMGVVETCGRRRSTHSTATEAVWRRKEVEHDSP